MIRANKRRYHFIYKTTCLITKRYYIGMHSTENLEDGYIGSGTRLWNSIKKHGREVHVCEIIEFQPGRKELAAREAQIVNEELLDDELCMNLNLGGNGGWTVCNKVKTTEQRKETGRKVLQKAWKDPEYIEKRKKICSTHLRKLHEEGRIKYGSFRGQSHSRETKEKIGKTVSSLQQGEQNSQFGTCWIYHELIGSRKCKKELLPEYLEQGWYKGRNLKIFA